VIGTVVLAAAVLAAVFLFLGGRKRARTTQDVVCGAAISPDGLVQSGNVFRVVIEVEPMNLDTASSLEHQNVWTNFLTLINTLNLPYTLLVVTQNFEMKDYLTDLQRRLNGLDDLPPALRESGEQLVRYLSDSTEGAQVRDYRGYVILQYDPVAALSNAQIQTGVGWMDRLLGRGKAAGQVMNELEKAELARQALMDAAAIVFDFCEQIGMRYQLLNRAGVLNVTYQILQRDLSPHARMVDAIQADAFHPMKRSLTAQAHAVAEGGAA